MYIYPSYIYIGDARDIASVPGSGRSPGGRHGNLFQYSCLENLMGRGAWQATIHGVAKSQIRLSDTFTSLSHAITILLYSSVNFATFIFHFFSFSLSPQPLKAPLEVRRYIRSPGGLVSKESTCNEGNLGSIPVLGRSPGEGQGYSSILAWRIPWTVSFMGSQRVGHN